MTITKAKLICEGHPEARRDEGSPLITSVARDDKMDPQTLLDGLRQKQCLFETLKKEGLIHQGKHLALEQRLKETIKELETLIPQLEDSKNVD